MAVQGDRTIGSDLHEAQIETSRPRACVIPSEHHVAVPDNEQIVLGEAPSGPPDRGRITDTRVGLPEPRNSRPMCSNSTNESHTARTMLGGRKQTMTSRPTRDPPADLLITTQSSVLLIIDSHPPQAKGSPHGRHRPAA
jgi:hypothetical protein